MTTTTKMIEVTGFTGMVASLASLATRFVNRMIVVRRNRKAIFALGEWNDQMLHDIGITRADLHAAIGTSLLDDPSEKLGALADVRARVRTAQQAI